MSLEKIERQIEKRLGKSLITPLLERVEKIEKKLGGEFVAELVATMERERRV